MMRKLAFSLVLVSILFISKPLGLAAAQDDGDYLEKLSQSGNVIFWEYFEVDEKQYIVYADRVQGGFLIQNTEAGWSNPVRVILPFFDENQGMDVLSDEIQMFSVPEDKLAVIWADNGGQLFYSEKWFNYLETDFLWETSTIDTDVKGFEALKYSSSERLSIVYLKSNDSLEGELLFKTKSSVFTSWSDPIILEKNNYLYTLGEINHLTINLVENADNIHFVWINPINGYFQQFIIDPVIREFTSESVQLRTSSAAGAVRNILFAPSDARVIFWEEFQDGVCTLKKTLISETSTSSRTVNIGNQGCLKFWQKGEKAGIAEIHASFDNRDLIIINNSDQVDVFINDQLPVSIFDSDRNSFSQVETYQLAASDEANNLYVLQTDGDIWAYKTRIGEQIPLPEEITENNYQIISASMSKNPIDFTTISGSRRIIARFINNSNKVEIVSLKPEQPDNLIIQEIPLLDDSYQIIGIYEQDDEIYVLANSEEMASLLEYEVGSGNPPALILPDANNLQLAVEGRDLYLVYFNSDNELAFIKKRADETVWNNQKTLSTSTKPLSNYQALALNNTLYILLDYYDIDLNQTRVELIQYSAETDLSSQETIIEGHFFDDYYLDEINGSPLIIAENEEGFYSFNHDRAEMQEITALSPNKFSDRTFCAGGQAAVQAGLDSYRNSIEIVTNNQGNQTLSNQNIALDPDYDYASAEIVCSISDGNLLLYVNGSVERTQQLNFYTDFIISITQSNNFSSEIILDESIDEETGFPISSTETTEQGDEIIRENQFPKEQPQDRSDLAAVVISLLIPAALAVGVIYIRIRKN